MSELRDKFLGSQSKRFEMLEFPELGIKVKVKGISYAVRGELIRDAMLSSDQLDMVKMVPRAIIATFHDPLNDKPLFTAADNDVIASLDFDVIEKARQVIWRVIGLSHEVMEKNSDQTLASAPSTV